MADIDTHADRLYNSRALREAEWAEQRAGLLADGWEYLPPLAGITYIRKLLAGFPNDTARPFGRLWSSERLLGNIT